jgi:hypothetical protein
MKVLITGEKNKDQLRALYLNDLRDDFMKAFTRQREKIAEEELWKIAGRNQQLLNCKHPSFMYRNQWYAAIPILKPREMADWNRLLHPSLIKEVKALVDDKDFDDVVEESKLVGFFNNILGAVQHLEDLDNIIPSSFQFVSGIKADIFNIGPPLGEKEVERLKAENQEGIQSLNKLAMRELLLKKV